MIDRSKMLTENKCVIYGGRVWSESTYSTLFERLGVSSFATLCEFTQKVAEYISTHTHPHA